VLLTIATEAIGGGEHDEKVIVKVDRVGGGEAAGAHVSGRDGVGELVVGAAIGAYVVVAGERLVR
jgi:hypothetical protein